MVILLGLGLAAAVAATSYLVPLIITGVAAGIAVIITFVSTRHVYKKKNTQDNERQDLKREQDIRDNKIREEVSKIAEETGLDVQFLLNLSKEQQQELKAAIVEFIHNIEESDLATKSLNQVASSIQTAANSASEKNQELYTELEKIKTELAFVHNKLKQTEQSLAMKEIELHGMIEKLTSSSTQMSDDFALNIDNSADFHSNLTDSYAMIANYEMNSSAKKDELSDLKEKNTHLSKTIETLKNTVAHLKQNIYTQDEKDQAQINEIQSLITENKHLTQTIEALANSMEEQNKQKSTIVSSATNQLRLFKN
ncbi:MAG: hypothetical protein P1U74_00265 [Legionellaceae bacterium]|nr:hypothetical protein [Legionellaceae bacterium]